MGAPYPLFSLLRDGLEEIFIHGEIVVSGGGGVLFQSSEVIGNYPARSLFETFPVLGGGNSR